MSTFSMNDSLFMNITKNTIYNDYIMHRFGIDKNDVKGSIESIIHNGKNNLYEYMCIGITYNDIDIIKTIVEDMDVDINELYTSDIFMQIVHYDRLKILKYLVNQGLHPKIFLKEGRIFRSIIMGNQLELLKYLVDELGIEFNIRIDSVIEIRMYLYNCYVDTIAYLLEKDVMPHYFGSINILDFANMVR